MTNTIEYAMNMELMKTGHSIALTIAFIIIPIEIHIIKARSFNSIKTDFKDTLYVIELDMIFLEVTAFIETHKTPEAISSVFGI